MTLEQTKIEKETVHLNCPSHGDPKPVLNWFKDGEKISHSNKKQNIRLLNESEILEIVSSQPQDGGSYICRSENEAGYQHVEYVVKILGEVLMDVFEKNY